MAQTEEGDGLIGNQLTTQQTLTVGMDGLTVTLLRWFSKEFSGLHVPSPTDFPSDLIYGEVVQVPRHCDVHSVPSNIRPVISPRMRLTRFTQQRDWKWEF